MGDNSNSNVKIDITADASGTEPGFSQTEAKLDHLGKSSGKLASEYSGLDAATKKMTGSMSAAAVDTKKLDAELTSLLTRINPAYAAVKNLDQGTDLLHRGLTSGLITTQQYNSSIGLLEASFDKANRATGESAFMTARAKQEMVVLGRELAAGNFSRMPGTLSIIAQGLSPVAWGIAGITAALVAGGYAWWKWGEDARAASELARKGADAAREAADRAQQLTQMERLADISEKIGKLEREKVDLAEKSKRIGLAGGGGKGELFAYQETIDAKQREIAGLQRQAANLWDEIEKADKRANKPAKYKQEFDPEGDFWFAVDEAGIKNRRKKRDDDEKAAERSATETAKKIADANEKEAKRAAQSWERFTENVQHNLGDVLYNQLNGKFTDIGELFKQMLLRMAADAASANLTKSLFGGVGSFSGIGTAIGTALGMNGGMVDPVTGLPDAGPVPYSYAGGGYTGSGSRSGGVDGMGGFRAILHPNETVIDHSAGQGGGGMVVNITNNAQAQVSATQRQDSGGNQILDLIIEPVKQALMHDLSRGGEFSSALAGRFGLNRAAGAQR